MEIYSKIQKPKILVDNTLLLEKLENYPKLTLEIKTYIMTERLQMNLLHSFVTKEH